MIQIWDGTKEDAGQFILQLKIPTMTCDECWKVIHDLKHNVWPKGKVLGITPDTNPHGTTTGFHVSWLEAP